MSATLPHSASRSDEVDQLVTAWERERPDLDFSPMHVLSRVSRLARQLDRHRSAAFALHNLEAWEFDVLAALRRAGMPYQLSPGQLTKETMVTSGTMTNRLDRLAVRGLVERGNHPEDRRGVVVTLTGTGKDTVDRTMADLMQAEQSILATLPPARHEELAGALKSLLGGISATR